MYVYRSMISMVFVVGLFVVCSVGIPAAEPNPSLDETGTAVDPDVQAYFSESDGQRKSEIEMIGEYCRESCGTWTKKTKKYIEDLQSAIAYRPNLEARLNSVGHLLEPIRIIQRIDDASGLVEAHFYNGIWNQIRGTCDPVVVYRVLEARTILLRNVNFKSHADGDDLDAADLILKVVGTTKYSTALGSSKTVYVVQPVSDEIEGAIVKELTKRKELRKQKLEQEQKKPPTKASSYTLRTWTDSTGKYTVEAKFRGVIAGMVRLEKADGQKITLPMGKLSKEDQEWIHDPSKRKPNGDG